MNRTEVPGGPANLQSGQIDRDPYETASRGTSLTAGNFFINMCCALTTVTPVSFYVFHELIKATHASTSVVQVAEVYPTT